MALEGPRVVYTRREEESPLERALRLAREVEELLEETSSVNDPDRSVHSTRIARAMAAGLVDELQSLDRIDRKRRLC
ncbi:MAG: hypothetical protein KIT84_25870 [Labilithrix sp.]|nr:hypothetical protein [Labilithrix sp.]MCW5814482.1 hypothetical protein [Labilithrix sp.]